MNTRVNVFASGEGKAAHQDRSAYVPGAGDLTVTMYIGAARICRFINLSTPREVFDVELTDGSIFAFDAELN
eukprot:11491588-Karenia_brevis.AAC.1